MSCIAWQARRTHIRTEGVPLLPALRVGLLLVCLGIWVCGSANAGEEDLFTAQGFVRFQQEPKAPDFTLLDHEGTPRSLRDFQGHAILLVFWTTW